MLHLEGIKLKLETPVRVSARTISNPPRFKFFW